MTQAPDLTLASQVLRNNAPRYAHDVRRACMRAADLLEGIVYDPDDSVALSMPVRDKGGEIIGYAQMMLMPSPEGPIGVSSWFTPVPVT